ncbi:hypothetical protein [Deinococcus arcticus]|uniref:Uncharacterized protein n=1 Tax=Deinococcus arcticus TaxID=2136176 RepID=A0A2T3WCI4_9DEIO|nr:hypothetical protein [Deinococcus arcticus]PTA69567.1 hypothetical protein C8263_00615 [Deinococcus arcticus]
MSRRIALLVTAALILTPALAQTTPAPAPTTVTLPGQVPTALKDAWSAFLASGGSASLLDSSGAVIGTLNADGTLSLNAGKALSDVKAVRLQPRTGQATTVNVARDLSRPGAVKIEWMGPNGKMQSLPLPAVVNRALRADASVPPATTPDDDRSGKDSQDDKDKDDKSNKGKSDSAPGKGKGKS